MLDGLKGRLNIGGRDRSRDDGYFDEYDEYAQDWDDYGEGDSSLDAGFDSHDAYDGVTTRSAGANRRRAGSYADRASSSLGERRAATSHPPLVNIDDVKESTRVPDSLQRDPLPPRRRGASARASVGHASDYSLSGSEVVGAGAHPASPLDAPSTESTRSSGYDSLFDSSSATAVMRTGSTVSSTSRDGRSSREGYDPYKAYEGDTSANHAPARRVTTVAPSDYGEVEAVSRALKAGDAVVLSLKRTDNQLSKRVLDFSFGVASALDASVDCIADQVFALTRGRTLADSELADLRAKGVV